MIMQKMAKLKKIDKQTIGRFKVIDNKGVRRIPNIVKKLIR